MHHVCPHGSLPTICIQCSQHSRSTEFLCEDPAITKQDCEGDSRVSKQGADSPKRPRFLFSPELTLKAEGSSKGILRKTNKLLTYLFLLVSLPSNSQPFTVTIITQKKRERTDSSFFFQSFFTHQSTTGRECWLSMCISRSEIKIVELILCTGLTIPVKTKYVSMYNIRNTNCIILMILCELNALMYAIKTCTVQYKNE